MGARVNVSPADRELVTALLEDGAHHVNELAGWLDRSRPEATALLHALKAERLVQQSRSWWSLVADVPAVATPVAAITPAAQSQALRVPDVVSGRTRIIDGVEYEVWKSGRDSLMGSVDGMNSPLTGECHVSRR